MAAFGGAALRPVRTTAAEVAQWVGGRLVGDPAHPLTGIAGLDTAQPSDISFLAHPRYAAQLAQSQAGCVLLAESALALAAGRPAVVVCAQPYQAFATLTQRWAEARVGSDTEGSVDAAPLIHPSATVHAEAQIGAGCRIGPGVVIGARARVGVRSVIGPHSVLEDDAQLGADARLGSHVVLGERCRVGARAVLHAGVVIGADGFGFAPGPEGAWIKIAQLAAVTIGDDVEIGANSCVDRGALEDTVLEDGVKLDNLVQIAHNVRVGAHTAMAACVGVAGSARIGARCSIGGGAIVLGHLEVAAGTVISAATVVTRSIRVAGTYSGVFPFDDNAAWEKNAATLRQLHALRDRIRALEKQP